MSGSFDASEFLKGLDLADQRIRRAAVRGVAKVLLDLKRLAKERVPVETGTLAGTIVADASGILAGGQKIEGFISAGGGEASDYAVRQHEVPMNHKFPRAGFYASKFIEGPLKFRAPTACQVIADEVRGELG